MAKITGFAEGLDMPVRERRRLTPGFLGYWGWGGGRLLLFTEIEVTRSPSLVYFALGGF